MRRCILLAVPLLCALLSIAQAGETDLALKLRSLKRVKSDDKVTYEFLNVKEKWNPKQSAVIVCDMWDTHHCYNAVVRVEEMAPRMNEVLEKCRKLGMTIIHAPSSCMDAYKDHPGRKRAKDAP